MSLNEEKDGDDPSKVRRNQNVQDELVRGIHVSLNNIATQVDNLNKHAEGILGALSKEVDLVCCRYSCLQHCVTQVNNTISTKNTQKEPFFQATKSMSSHSASIQTDLDYPLASLPAKVCETHDVSVQTVPLYMFTPSHQNGPQVLVVPKFQEDKESLRIPYSQDSKDDSMIPYCQDNEHDVMIPYCIDSDPGLVVSANQSYYSKTHKEKVRAGVNEQVQERFRKKNKHVDHPIEVKNVPQITLRGKDITVGRVPPTCLEKPSSQMKPSVECSGFSTYPINEISKVLTKAVGKVIVSPTHPPRKEFNFQKISEPYVRYGIGKGEMKPQPRIQSRPKIEAFVSPTAPASPPPLPPNWLSMLRDSKKEHFAFKMQFPSPVSKTSPDTHLHTFLQTSPEVDIQTIDKDDDDFEFPPPPPDCCGMLEDDLLNDDSENEMLPPPPLPASPAPLQRIEEKDKSADLLAHASFIQSPLSFAYPHPKASFSKSPKFSASRSQRPLVLSPSSSQDSSTRYTDSTCSNLSNAALPRYSRLETYQSSVSLSESFSQSTSSVSSGRYSSIYTPTRSISPKRSEKQSSRFSMYSVEKTCIEQPTENLVPPSKQSSSLNATKSFTIQSLFSFQKPAPSSIPSPQALSVLQYAENSVNPDPNQRPIFTKEGSVLIDSVKKGVSLRKTEDHCILKAQIEISKK